MALTHKGFWVRARLWDGKRTAMELFVDEWSEYERQKPAFRSDWKGDGEVYTFDLALDQLTWMKVELGQWVISDGAGDFIVADYTEVVEVAQERLCCAGRLDCQQEGSHYHCPDCGDVTGMLGHYVGGVTGRVICDEAERDAYLVSLDNTKEVR